MNKLFEREDFIDSVEVKGAEFKDEFFLEVSRPVNRGGARGAFALPPQAPKVRILILIIQVKECCRLNWSLKLNNDV